MPEIVGEASISRSCARLLWLQELGKVRKEAIEQAKSNPTVASQLAGIFLMSPTSEKTFELLEGTNYEEVDAELANCVKTIFGMGGTLACELANKATRKQQDRAQEHGKVAGERMLNHKMTPPRSIKYLPKCKCEKCKKRNKNMFIIFAQHLFFIVL